MLEKLLERYNSQRESFDSFGGLVEESLKLGNQRNLAWNYVAAGILAMQNGDIGTAITTLNKGIEADPSADAPHQSLVRAYYQLAFFDAVDRGNCQINLIPVNDIDSDNLNRGPLMVEIDELLKSGRPEVYRIALNKVGFTEDQKMQAMLCLRLARQNRLTPDQQQDLRKAAIDISSELGVASVLPVPAWVADNDTKNILQLAQKEVRLLRVCKPMIVPPGVIVGGEDIIEGLAERIDRLLEDNNLGRFDEAVSDMKRTGELDPKIRTRFLSTIMNIEKEKAFFQSPYARNELAESVYRETLEKIYEKVLGTKYPSINMLEDNLSLLELNMSRIIESLDGFEQNLKKTQERNEVRIPKPYSAADPKRASELNIQHQKEVQQYEKNLQEWEALPWRKRHKIKKPEKPKPPRGI